jgi:hypothetical protein|tara:strand:- start:76 stop:1869 length:1794 start_codon:yes stop_codon:yes gene_type:complete
MGNYNIQPVKYKYEQSSLHGTPGVDKSGAMLAKGLGQAFTTLQNHFLKEEAVTREIESNKQAQNIDSKARAGIAERQAEANGDPTIGTSDSMDIQRSFYDTFIQAEIDKISNRKLRQQTKKNLIGKRGAIWTGVSKWGIKREAIKALNSSTELLNEIAYNAEYIEDLDELESSDGLVQQALKAGQLAAPLLSDKNRKEILYASRTMAYRGYITGRKRDNPLTALEEYVTKLQKHFDPEDNTRILKELNNAVKGLDDTVNMSLLYARTSWEQEIIKPLFLNDNPKQIFEIYNDLKEEGKLTQALARNIETLFKNAGKNKKLSENFRLDLTADIIADFKNLKKDIEKGIFPGLEKLEILQNKIFQATPLIISRTKAAEMMSVLSPPTKQELLQYVQNPPGWLRDLNPFSEKRTMEAFDDKHTYWKLYFPNVDFKTGKFDIQAEQKMKVKSSFKGILDAAGVMWLGFTGVFNRHVNTAVAGLDKVETYVNALKNYVPKIHHDEIKVQMANALLSKYAAWRNNPENLIGEMNMSHVDEMLDDIINSDFMEGKIKIPDEGLPLLTPNGNKVKVMPNGKIEPIHDIVLPKGYTKVKVGSKPAR